MTKLNGNTRNAMTRKLIKAITAVAEHQLSNGYTYEPIGLTDMDIDEEEVQESIGSMSGTLLKYRKGYQKAVSYTQGPTLDNGDELATALRGLSPADVCAIADAVYNELPGSHFARYEHLNIGSRRMNAGNRIRGAIRKELITLAEVLVLTGTRDEAAE